MRPLNKTEFVDLFLKAKKNGLLALKSISGKAANKTTWIPRNKMILLKFWGFS